MDGLGLTENSGKLIMKFRRSLFSTLAVFMVIFAPFFGGASAQTFSDQQRGDIDSLIREYILTHPEVIAESMDRWRKRREADRDQRQRQSLNSLGAQVYENPMTPISGAAKGTHDLVIVEFFDYQCSYCKKAFPTVLKLLETDKKLRIAWKEFPILGPASRIAALAAMAAKKQGKYFEFHVALMSLKGRLSEQRIMKTAQKIGLDIARLTQDMNDPAISAYIEETLALGQSLGISGTPAFIIGEHVIPGAIGEDQMRQLIKIARAKKK
jgi:protein-disulfide isomerase